MATHKGFKVVIVGGSIAGLSLANMLQANGIDFVILEAYPSIAPQVGASLGLLPHGNRILDQLGVYKDILKLAPPVDHWSFRNHKGDLLAEHKGLAADFNRRHGYPILFLDRQKVLKVLYDNLRDKSKVLTNKRVIKVEMGSKNVTAIAKDGSTYSGDILVGADGVHSTVREEMWRLANDQCPGYFGVKDSTAIQCVYSCIFGISNPCPGIEPGTANSVFNEHSSYLVLGGLNSRCYWFFFFNIGQRVTGREFPRYTKAEEEEIIEKRKHDKILPNLEFGTLLENKVMSTLTALPEFVFRKWHHDRIVNIGDSAHKFEPITGHGGNAAIETSASLVNRLVHALRLHPNGLSTSQITEVFNEVQDSRHERVTGLVRNAHDQQRLEALEGPWERIKALYLLPRADVDDVMFNFSRNVPLSEKLDMIELPTTSKLIPFQDELGSSPMPRGAAGWVQIALYVVIAVAVYYGMWFRPAGYGLDKHFESTVAKGLFPDHPENFPVKRHYTGVTPIDEILTFLDAAFTPGIAGFHQGFYMLQLYFLGHLLQPITIWAVESVRKRNSMTVISFVSAFSLVYQLRGVGVIMPLWNAAYVWISEPESYWWPLNREVPIYYAKAILPAVLLGYGVPVVLMFWPWWNNPDTIQNMVAFWQPSPIYVQILLVLFGFILKRMNKSEARRSKKLSNVPRQKAQIVTAELDDIVYLTTAYAWTFGFGVALHVWCMYRMLASTDPTLSPTSVFWPDWSATLKSHGEGLRNLWLPDFYGFFVASYLWCCFAFWDLQRVGRLTIAEKSFGVARAILLISLGQIVIGPGATMSAVWYWRERALARTSVPRT